MFAESENYRKTTACAKLLVFCLSFGVRRFANPQGTSSAVHVSSNKTFLHGQMPATNAGSASNSVFEYSRLCFLGITFQDEKTRQDSLVGF
jgi:hypothetical protein